MRLVASRRAWDGNRFYSRFRRCNVFIVKNREKKKKISSESKIYHALAKRSIQAFFGVVFRLL